MGSQGEASRSLSIAPLEGGVRYQHTTVHVRQSDTGIRYNAPQNLENGFPNEILAAVVTLQ